MTGLDPEVKSPDLTWPCPKGEVGLGLKNMKRSQRDRFLFLKSKSVDLPPWFVQI